MVSRKILAGPDEGGPERQSPHSTQTCNLERSGHRRTKDKAFHTGSVASRHNARVPRRTPGRERQCATGAKLRGREDITIASWNVRTLRAAGKVEELLHEMDRYKWSILGLCEMRWKKSGEIPTDGGHRVYLSGKEDKHEQGVGFLVHKDFVKSVIGCRPISSRLMTVRLRASPFNITIIQVYAPTSSYDDSDVDEFYRDLQSLVDQTQKQDILVVQGDWNAKVGGIDNLLTMVKKRKLRWYGHISRSSGMAKTILQGTVKEARRRRDGKITSRNGREWGLWIP